MVSTTIEIQADPMEIWDVLTNLAQYGAWNPQIRSGSGEFRPGSNVTFHMGRPEGRSFTIRPKVLVAKPGVELRLLGQLPLVFSGEHFFQLERIDAGTRVVQGEIYRGVMIPCLRKVIAQAHDDFEQHNRALKDHVERPSHL